MTKRDLINHRPLLCFIADHRNEKQVKLLLKHLTKDQYNILREIAINVMAGNVPLQNRKFLLERIKKSSARLKKLSKGVLKRKSLLIIYPLLRELTKETLCYHDIC